MIYLENSSSIQDIFIPRQDVKKDAVSKYVTENELNDVIANETARTEEVYQKIADMSAYTPTSGFATINGSAITEGGNIVIQGGSGSTTYFAGENINIDSGNVISVTGITVPTKTSELQNDSGFITTADTQNFVDSGDVKTQIESYNYVNSGDVQNQIDSSISGKADSSAVTSQISEVKSEIEAEIPSKVSELQNDLYFASSGEVSDMIDSATSGKQDTLVSGTNIKTINNQSILGSGNIVIQGGSGATYSAGANIDIDENNVISVTGITVPTKLSDLQNDEDFVNSGDVASQINSALTGYSTTSEVEGMISGFTTSADVKTQIEGYNYINSGQAQTQIDNSISGKVDTTALTSYYTSAQTDTAIANAVSGKVDTSAMSAYTPTSGFSTINGSAITEGGDITIEGTSYSAGTGIGIESHIISVTGDYETVVELTQAQYDALTAYSENTTYIITDASPVEMSAYTPTSGFSTINGSAITEGGNIVIEGSSYSAGTNINIDGNNVISVTGITVPTKVSDLLNDSGFITSGEAQTQIDNSISGKADTSALTNYYTSAQTDTAISNAVSGKVDTSAMVSYYTSAQTDTAISNATSDFVTSGEVETQITGKGYITGYTETDPIFTGSPAYGITSGDISSWNAKLDSSDLIPYYTSAQTDTAISNATSGLQETLSAGTNIDITGNVVSVTGITVPTSNSAFTNDARYIPYTSDSSVAITGIRVISQTAYDNLQSVDANTIYIIKD